MAAPACIWLATLRSAASPVRIGAALALALLILTAALAYSRGAIIAYAVVLALIVAAGPRRLSMLAVGIGGVFAVAPALLLAFTRDDLSGSGVPLDDRVTGGILLGLITLVCLVALALGMRELIRAEERIAITPRQRRNAWRALAAAAAIGVVALVVVAVGAEGGLDGEVTQSADPATGAGNTPGRLVSVNSSNRTEWWREATEAFADRPLTGRGAGAFPVIHYLYRDEVADVRSSHSLPLMFLSETGLIGFVLGMGALLGLAWAAVLRIRESEGIERSARIALAAAFAAWFVQSLYDWHWEIPGVTIPALIAIVVAAAPTPRRRRYAKPEAPPPPRRTGRRCRRAGDRRDGGVGLPARPRGGPPARRACRIRRFAGGAGGGARRRRARPPPEPVRRRAAVHRLVACLPRRRRRAGRCSCCARRRRCSPTTGSRGGAC